jgi:carboxyl-terminal processing protease
MKRLSTNFLVLSIICYSQVLLAYVPDSITTLKPQQKHITEVSLIKNILMRNHYRKQVLNDSLSEVMFNNYINSLDAGKTNFLQSDMDYFSKYRTTLDNDIESGNVDVGFQIFRIFRERSNTRLNYVDELLKNGFDYSKNESIKLDSEDEVWASDESELNERWRKIIKSQALSLKLSGKADEEIKKTLSERYQRYQKGINQYNNDDVFQFYMNSFTSSFDPHTNYFSPISSENFKISMSQSLEGIGAQLTQKLDYIMVNEIIPGGPAYKSKSIHKGDKIVGVAQGDDGEFVNLIGWRVIDAVQLIRGDKGSIVRLELLKDGSTSEIPEVLRLERDKIKLESQSAKAEVIPISDGNNSFKLGVITIPSFYMDFDGAREGQTDYKSTTRDVKKLLVELQEKQVDGVMIDLRYNGGGSLKEAIDLSGLFVSSGPMVQVKGSNGRIDVKRDTDVSIQYNGPLAVLVNRFSASASEIFAGAIQDYERGIIVGETSFGKGTVQQLIGLNQFLPAMNTKLGQLKLTLQKFYRVTGSSTQNIGVTPDIEFPSAFDTNEFGESSQPNALPWDKISSSQFQKTSTISDEMKGKLRQLYANHLDTDVDLQKMVKDIERSKIVRAKTFASLNYDNRKETDEAIKADAELNKQALTQSAGKINKEFASTGEDTKKLNEDPYLKEGLRILTELIKFKVG